MSTQMVPMHSPVEGASSNSAPIAPARYVCFGAFHLDLQKGELLKDGSRIKLQGKVYQALLALLQKPGEIVTREELRMQLWPSGRCVNYDANVNTTVNKLRQVLGDSPDQPLFVETIPRKGYSFISTAEFSDVPCVVAPPAGPQTGAPGRSANSSEVAATDSVRTKRWLTVIIVGLILAGMLLGAGVATYWISHFAPQLRHSAAKNANCVPSSNAC
jgi:DNA-binding winged helix-turn-helix (wHTH) protein